jgi:hypothetical protein
MQRLQKFQKPDEFPARGVSALRQEPGKGRRLIGLINFRRKKTGQNRFLISKRQMLYLAGAQGFEPWKPFSLPVFKTGAIDHSAKPPAPTINFRTCTLKRASPAFEGAHDNIICREIDRPTHLPMIETFGQPRWS